MTRTTTPWTSLALCCSLAVGAPAAAQDPERDAPLSSREKDYVDTLERRFGPVSLADRTSFVVGERRVTARISDGSPGASGAPATPSASVEPPPSIATGVLVRAGDTTVARYRFESPEHAQQEVLDLLGQERAASSEPLVGEVRGDQVLVLSGELARDPTAAREALDGAWQGLPAAGSSDATFAVLGPHDVVLTTTLKDGPLRRFAEDTIAKVRARAAGGAHPGMEVLPDGVRTRFPSGFEANVTSDARGATVRTTGAPGGPATQEYLALLDPNRDAEAAAHVRDANRASSAGASSVLDGLFD